MLRPNDFYVFGCLTCAEEVPSPQHCDLGLIPGFSIIYEMVKSQLGSLTVSASSYTAYF